MAEIPDRYNYQFIHNVYAHFFRDTANYFSEYLYPRFEWVTIGTYDKAVEYITKREQFNRETDKPMLPGLILNPIGEFGMSDYGGKQYWRFPNLAPGIVDRIFDAIYQDANVLITPSFSRIRGEIELIMLLNSFYEYCDMRMLMFLIFGGLDRIIYPRWFHSFIILPDEVYNYEYYNPVTGERYHLNWESAHAHPQLVKTTNRNEIVVPCSIRPWYKLTGVTDSSTRYGGDKLADWRLSAMLEYEVEIPSFIVLKSDYLAEGIDFEIRYSSCYTKYPEYNIPVNRDEFESRWEWNLDSTSSQIIHLKNDPKIVKRENYVFKTRYFHIVTKEEADSTADIIITMPEQITDEKLLILNSKSGQLNYWDHYVLEDNGNTLVIKRQNVNVAEGDIIELYVYGAM